MRLSWTILTVLGCILTVGVSFAFYTGNRDNGHVITKTKDGFEPKTIEIGLGETVTFVNDSGGYFWPAANSHPTHSSLKAFDPREPIEDGHSWSFTFNEAGKWGFHDHLFPGERGMIIAGNDDEIEQTCNDTEMGIGPRLYCWGNAAREIIAKDGFDKVFNWFAEKYRSDVVFRDNCHDVTHVIGEIAYEAFEDDQKTITRPETSYCGYGFYHGFIELALASYGSDYEKKSREYCDLIGRSDSFETKFAAKAAMDACDHGIGHAVFDSINSNSWGEPLEMLEIGFATCKRMFSDDQHRRISCGSGVSNALAKAHAHSQYYFEPSTEDPTGVCQEIDYEFRRNCYMELGIHYSTNMDYDVYEAIEYMKGFEDEDITAWSILAFVDNEVRYHAAIDRLSEIYDACASLSNAAHRDGCIHGVIIGLRTGGDPGEEHTKMIEFCSMFDESSDGRRTCSEQMFSKLLGIYDPKEYAAVCREIDEKMPDRSAECQRYVESFDSSST